MSSSALPQADLTPAETYQVDSDQFDSGSDADSLQEDEYEALVKEADAGYNDEEAEAFVAKLKEDGLVNFLREYLTPRPDGSLQSIRKLLLGLNIVPPRHLREPGTSDLALLPFAKVALSRVLRRRAKLDQFNSIDDAVSLLRNAKRIMVLSGAGISTSCGIPDFRSSTGLYATLQAEGRYDLDDPQQMFDIAYFREHPEVFFSFAKQIYPSNFVPSPCHRWIKLLEDRNQLLRNYTQNIDTLESLAGVDRVLQCHGSFKTASCLRCKKRVPGSAIEPYIMAQQIPYCVTCRAERDTQVAAIRAHKAARKANGKAKSKAVWDDDETESDNEELEGWGRGEPGIIKPDITFFGQPLDSEFDECLFRDREEVDLLVIMGTSLKVAPVSEVLSHIPHSVPQIFINLTAVTHVKPDVMLLGDADSIVSYLSDQLGWSIPAPPAPQHGDRPVPELKVHPKEAVWVSGEGEWAHVHMLRSKEQMARAAETWDEEDDDDETDEENHVGQQIKVAASNGDHSDSDESSGSESDDEREETDYANGDGRSRDSSSAPAPGVPAVSASGAVPRISLIVNGHSKGAGTTAPAKHAQGPDADRLGTPVLPREISSGLTSNASNASMSAGSQDSDESDRPAKRSRVGSKETSSASGRGRSPRA